jgi:pseudaminic acid cytidylyltransferase
MNIAIVPARGGSKRIRRKNIRDFAGKPMITYALRAAFNSGLFSHVVVSTDDHEIAELSDDYSSTVSVVGHAIDQVGSLGWFPEFVCCIYPAVPLIYEFDLDTALKLLEQRLFADYSFPITQFSSPTQRALRVD